ncbi:MAG: Xaa-Pro peptidase family protein [Planctomycetota bacterium]
MASRAGKSIEISTDEYVKRRAAVLRALKGSVGVVSSGDGGGSRLGRPRSDDHFFYLTGLRHEVGAHVLFDPSAPDARRRCVLFLKPRDPDLEVWDGRRDPIGDELRSRLGFERMMRTWAMPRALSEGARRTKRLACLHAFAAHTQPVSTDLALFRRVSERMVGVSIEDRTEVLPRLRSVKSAGERRIMQRAIDITRDAFEAAAGVVRPGVSEAEVQTTIEHAFRSGGGVGPSFDIIAAGGVNATVLHYIENEDDLRDGDLMLIDHGVEYHGYASDITRCLPVSGRFTARQREVYNVVLKAQRASIRAVKPGALMSQVDAAARKIIDAAGFGDTFVHGIGHHLGIAVHDVDPDTPLKPGMVVTIEPGVYLEDEAIGVRLEDDVLVTSDGRKNLSSAIPIEADDIEALMAKSRGHAPRGKRTRRPRQKA